MKTPFCWISLGFAFGIILERWVRMPAPWILGSLGLGLIVMGFLRGKKIFLFLLVIWMTGAGILSSRLDSFVPEQAVQRLVSPERVSLTGSVSTLPEIKTRGKRVSVSFVLDARSVTRTEKGRRKKIPVTGRVQTFLIQPPFVPQVGDELRLFGVLELPRQVLNPGEFDYGKFLKERNVYAICQTIGPRSVRQLRQGPWYLPARLVAEARRGLARIIDSRYAAGEAAIMKALVLGLRSDIAPAVRDQFMRTGTVHLLAISGLNITMIAGSFYLLFILCGGGHQKAAAWTALIVVIYMGLAGFGLPVQRAGYVAVLMFLGILAGRETSLFNAMWAVFFMLLWWDPGSLWNVGFQLSFLSVFSLILIVPFLNRFNRWSLSLGSSLAVLAGTFPVVLYYFNTFSPVSVVANLAAIPIFDAALFTSLFTLLFNAVPFLGSFWAKISSGFLWMGLGWVKFLAGWPWGYWFFVKPSVGHIVCYYGSLAACLTVWKQEFRWKRGLAAGFAIVWLALAVSFFWKTAPGDFQLTFFSSGRNQAAHVQFSNRAQWLINAGRNFPSDQGEWLLAPFLRQRGIRELDGILFTDLSKKNTGGLPAIVRNFQVRHLLYAGSNISGAGNITAASRVFRKKARGVRAGDKIRMGKETLEVVAQSRSGTAVLISSPPWRILVLSRMEPALFKELLTRQDFGEIHAVFLLSGRREVPSECSGWLSRQRPLLMVLPDGNPELEASCVSLRIPFLNLKQTGALVFKRKEAFFDLESFLRGKIGLYSYSGGYFY